MDFRDDKEVLETFVEEAGDRVSEIESGILDLERAGLEVDPEVIHGAFRAAHSIKATANLLDFKHIGELSHKMENILEMFRNQELLPDDQVVAVLLEGLDKIQEMVENVEQSDSMDISSQIEKLARLVKKPPS
ncbi:MAG: Hpt domain-containing protein [Thermodesulfobacteriota bacterium]|nr:Hpt domain-containing protein [Thermodesulfobacteriota bacterium]